MKNKKTDFELLNLLRKLGSQLNSKKALDSSLQLYTVQVAIGRKRTRTIITKGPR